MFALPPRAAGDRSRTHSGCRPPGAFTILAEAMNELALNVTDFREWARFTADDRNAAGVRSHANEKLDALRGGRHCPPIARRRSVLGAFDQQAPNHLRWRSKRSMTYTPV